MCPRSEWGWLGLAALIALAPTGAVAGAASVDPAHRYVVLIDGIRSQAPASPDAPGAKEDFAQVRAGLMGTVGHFVYFSYRPGAEFPHVPQFYCNGWACAPQGAAPLRPRPDAPVATMGRLASVVADPVYSFGDTLASVDDQAEVLDWLLGQVVEQDPAATIDLVGFSLGGVIGARWAARHAANPAAHQHVHGLVLIDSPVGGIPLAGPALDGCRSTPVVGQPGCWLLGLGLRLLFGEQVLAQLQAPDTASGSVVSALPGALAFDVTSIQSSTDYLVNGQPLPLADTAAPLGRGAQAWGRPPGAQPLVLCAQQALGGQAIAGPLDSWPELLDALTANHMASLAHPQTAAWVRQAVVRPPGGLPPPGCALA